MSWTRLFHTHSRADDHTCLLLSIQAMRRPCQLSHRTEPLVIRNQPNASVELLVISISKPGVAALTCMDSPNVHIKNVRIEHAHGGVGIRFERCPSLRLEDVSVVAVAAPSRPTRCLLRNQDCDNIHGSNSADVVLHRVRVSGGATGVELHLCPRARVTYFVAMDVLGPYPRGQCIQFASSHGATLDHFYCRNEPSASWTEDSVSVWRSGGAVVSNGLVDGNNSPTGVGVMFENDAAAALGGAIENVDAINMGNGCFSGYPARDLVMTRTRCGWNHCGGLGGRAPPTSHGQMWAAGHAHADDRYVQAQMAHSRSPHRRVTSSGIVVSHGRFWAPCNETKAAWWARTPQAYRSVQIKRLEFKPRQPLTLRFCWEQRAGATTSGGGGASRASLTEEEMAPLAQLSTPTSAAERRHTAGNGHKAASATMQRRNSQQPAADRGRGINQQKRSGMRLSRRM